MHSRIAIPDYSLAEELISAISHGIGTGLAIAGCVLCIVKAVCDRVGAAGIVSAAIFGGSMSAALGASLSTRQAQRPGTDAAKMVFTANLP